ncbi:Insulin-like growth factor-binding protein-related protein 1 [Nymphon striatum]|nr:Insulin-like growth factor-binding protein-related protein 1 [Nymphon striatum]
MFPSRSISAFLLLVVIHGCLVSAQSNLRRCERCDKSKCATPPVECPNGIKLDNCDCCYVCARKEGQRCDTKKGYQDVHGVCGDDLACKLRDDLPSNDPPEALCYCNSLEPACGSDGRNYGSICKLNEERYRNRNSGLTLGSRGLCPTLYTNVWVKEQWIKLASAQNSVENRVLGVTWLDRKKNG